MPKADNAATLLHPSVCVSFFHDTQRGLKLDFLGRNSVLSFLRLHRHVLLDIISMRARPPETRCFRSGTHLLASSIHVLERASRPRNVAALTAVTDELMEGGDIKDVSRVVEC